MKPPVRVAVTGAAGQIGYALLFRIAAGDMLGKDQPVILQLLELPIDKAQAALRGVMMELEDCAFPLLAGMTGTGDPRVAFKDADYALLVGAKPRGPGHGAQGPPPRERQDLHRAGQGARRGCLAQRQGAGRRQSRQYQRLHRDEIGAVAAEEELHRHDAPRPQPRAVAGRRQGQAFPWARSRRWSCGATTRRRCIPTTASRITAGKELKSHINDENWNRNEFLPKVGKRGAAIIEARGLSSAASAANAAIDHMRDWILGSNGKWVTMGIPSDGSYGIPEDYIYGVPVTTANGEYTRIRDLPIDEFSRERMNLHAEGDWRKSARGWRRSWGENF